MQILKIYITDLDLEYQSDEDDMYERSRFKRKVQSLDTALDILNYDPYLPTQSEKTYGSVTKRQKTKNR